VTNPYGFRAGTKYRPFRENRTGVTVSVGGRFLIGPRSRVAADALSRLYDLVQTAAEL
jgi:hypothetical protein